MFVNVAQDVGICEWRRSRSNVNTNETKDKNNQKPWFDTECRAARREYLNIKNSLKRKLKFVGASEANCLLNNYKSAGRLYKNLLRHKRRKYYRDLNESLRSLQASNPKEYWQLLNNNNERKRKRIGNVSLGDFVNHFSRLGNGQDDQSTCPGDNISEFSEADGALNAPVTFREVELMIRKLKNSKACGKDFIRNEFLKNCPIEMLHVLVKFFNVVLDSGIVPTEWCIGIIIPIFKNKGVDTNPDNYRGITLLSCLGKLFTSILNHRISLFFEAANMLGEEQAGFRSNYSTTDNIFVLKSIIDIYLRNKKRLYCAFIDYKKAFDLIDRSSLWYKMLKMGLRGKLFTVIKNIYESAKSCVAVRGEMSEFFTCNTGVRQGENLSPLLFAIYLNDFQEYISNSYGGLKYLESELSDCLELGFDNANVALNLSCLLYADDTIILAETPEELQKALDAVDSYCQTWHLTVNASKTKVVIFSRGKVRRIPEFVYGGDPLEVVDDFVYLGVKFNYNGSFKKAISKQVTQARKALYSMLVKAKKLQLSVDTQCHLFDHLVLPVLLYGCEVWGYECIDQIEVFHRKFLRKVLNVNKCTPDCMVYGETGRGVILNHIKCRMIGFWLRLVKGKETKHSCVLLKFLLHLRADIHSPSKSQWLSFIANLFDTAGLGNVWLAQGVDLVLHGFHTLQKFDFLIYLLKSGEQPHGQIEFVQIIECLRMI